MHARTRASNSDALARVRYPLSIVQLNTPFLCSPRARTKPLSAEHPFAVCGFAALLNGQFVQLYCFTSHSPHLHPEEHLPKDARVLLTYGLITNPKIIREVHVKPHDTFSW